MTWTLHYVKECGKLQLKNFLETANELQRIKTDWKMIASSSFLSFSVYDLRTKNEDKNNDGRVPRSFPVSAVFV